MDDDPLRTIADRLLPLVQRHLAWWREAVKRWADNPPTYPDEFGEGSPIEEATGIPLIWLGRERIDYRPILPVPFPWESLTHDERLAMLAAIHDTYADGVERIDPWHDLPGLTEVSDSSFLEQHRVAIRYDILLSRVSR